MGTSYVWVNSTATDDWYNGSGTGHKETRALGTLSELNLGGEIQTYGDGTAGGHVVELKYVVYPSSAGSSDGYTWGTKNLTWYQYANNNNYFRMGGETGASLSAASEFAGLAAGSYKLEIYYQQQTGATSWLYEYRDNFVFTFSVEATLGTSGSPSFSTTYGTAAAAQSFTVTATHLTDNLTVTAPEGFAVCLTEGGTYGSSVTLERSGNAVSETVWVKMTATSVGNHSGNLTVSGGSATAVNVGVSGTIAALAPSVTEGTKTVGVGSATFPATVNAGGAETTVGFLWGTGGSYGTSGTVTQGGAANPTVAAGATAAPVSVTLNNLVANTTYNYKWTASHGGAQSVEVVGTAFTTDCFPENAWSLASPAPTATGGTGSFSLEWGAVAGAGDYLMSVWKMVAGTVEDTLNFGCTYGERGFEEQTDATGTTMTVTDGSVTLGTMTFGDGNASYVTKWADNGLRVYGSTTGGGWFQFKVAKGVTLKSVTLKGVSGKTQTYKYTLGSASAVTVSTWPSNLESEIDTGDLGENGTLKVQNFGSSQLVLSRIDFEYEAEGETPDYESSYPAAGASVKTAWENGSGTVTVGSLDAGTTYHWKLTAVGGNAGGNACAREAEGTVDTATVPTVTASPNPLTGLKATVGANGAAGTLTVGGTHLTANVTVTVASGALKVSLDGSEWGNSVSLVKDGATVAETPVYVRLTSGAGAAGDKNGSLTVASSGAESVTVTVNGTVYAAATGGGSGSATVWTGDTATLAAWAGGGAATYEVSTTADSSEYTLGAGGSVTFTPATAGEYVFTVTAWNGAHDVAGRAQYTWTVTARASQAGKATWMGNTYVVVGGTGGTWYRGTGEGNSLSFFNGASLGTLSSLTLGGQAQTWNENRQEWHPDSVTLAWSITVHGGSTPASSGTIPMTSYQHPHNYWYGMGEGSSDAGTAVSLAGLTGGTLYDLAVSFSTEGPDGTIYDNDSVGAVTYTATFRTAFTTPTVSVGTDCRGTLTGDSGVTYVVVRDTENSFDGTVSGSAPDVGGSWGGGTVAYVGTATSFTDWGAAGCNSYYWKAWAVKDGVWSAGSAVFGPVTIATPGAPVLAEFTEATKGATWIQPTWNAVPGAVKYRLDVFTGSELGDAVMEETFAGWTTTGSSYTTSNSTNVNGRIWAITNCIVSPSGSAGANGVGSAGNVRLRKVDGTLTFPTASNVKTVRLIMRTGSGSGTATLYRDNNGTESELKEFAVESSPKVFTHTFASEQSGLKLRLKAGSESTSTIYLLDAGLYRDGTPVYVTEYENKDVGNVTSYRVTGLSEQTTYSVRVRAEGSSTACTSGDSNTETVTTLEDESLAGVTLANARGNGENGVVLAKTWAAGEVVLLQGTKATVAQGSVSPTLTDVRFAWTGTATGSDVSSIRVRVGTSATWDPSGAYSPLGSVTGGSAGTYTVHGAGVELTASASAETTYYIWVEAVTSGSAAGNRTMRGTTPTAADFTFENARLSASLSQPTWQTIANLTSLTAEAVTGEAGQLLVTWGASPAASAANGISVTVRWSATSLAAIPAPGTAWTDEATGLTGTSTTLEGLDACTTYYVKAWPVVTRTGNSGSGTVVSGTGIGATAQTASGATDEVGAPGSLAAGSPAGTTTETLTWGAVDGAAGYHVNLWHYRPDLLSGVAGTYTKITGEGGLSSGKRYVVGWEGTYGAATHKVAMNNDTTGGSLGAEDVTAQLDGSTVEVGAGDGAMVWVLESETVTIGAEETTVWTIRNAADEKYVSYQFIQDVNNPATTADEVTDSERWTLSVDANGVWTARNVANTGRLLCYNAQSPRFACYTSVQKPLMLYKQDIPTEADLEDSAAVGGSTAAVSLSESAGTVTASLTGLTADREYGWSVSATGGECESAATAGPGFRTEPVLSAPVFTYAGPIALDGVAEVQVKFKNEATGWPRVADNGYSVVCTSGGAALGTYGATGGQFTFTPGRSGVYGFRVTAVNSQGSDSYDITVTVVPAAPTVTASAGVTPGTASGTVTGESGATVALRRYGSASEAEADEEGTGGTDVTSALTAGAAGSWTFAETGLAGCTEYYYKAWQTTTAGEGASAVTLASAATVAGPVVPALAVPDPDGVGAGTRLALTWDGVPGAARYLVWVSSANPVVEGDSGKRVNEDFENGKPDTWKYSKVSTYGNNVWVYGGSGTALKFDDNAGGYAITPAFAAGADTTVGFWARGNGGSASTIAVQTRTDSSLGNTEGWSTVETFAISSSLPGTDQPYSTAIPETAVQVRFLFTKDGANVGLDRVRVTAPAVGSTLVYNDTVTSGELTVEGLATGNDYWYQVKAIGAGGCESGWSELTKVTIESAPAIEVSPSGHDFGTQPLNESATQTFAVRNTGSLPLTVGGITFAGEGAGDYSVDESAFTVDVGATKVITVTFTPHGTGERGATMVIANNGYNAAGEAGSKHTDVPLAGTGYDARLMPPTVYGAWVWDGAANAGGTGATNTVWDHSLAQGSPSVKVRVVAWHANGMETALSGTYAAGWRVLDAEGAEVIGTQAFTSVGTVPYANRTCWAYEATMPAWKSAGTPFAEVGTYTVEFTGWSQEGTTGRRPVTAATVCEPADRGWLFDDFTRGNRVGTSEAGSLGGGWTVVKQSGGQYDEAVVHEGALELYGANGGTGGTAGRVGVVADTRGLGYGKVFSTLTGRVSWGFHVKLGAATTGLSDGSTSGAFVLAAAQENLFATGTGQKGYAVAFTDDSVWLAHLSKGWVSGGTQTALRPLTEEGEVDEEAQWKYEGAQGKTLAVRVDYTPPSPAWVDGELTTAPAEFALYVKEVEKFGGNPLEECGTRDLVTTATVSAPMETALNYAGVAWAHGTAKPGETTGAAFDDIYLPHEEGRTEAMAFRVADEDTEAPEFDGFAMAVTEANPADMEWLAMGGAITKSEVWDKGLTVTGMVHDASGVVASTAEWQVFVGEEEESGIYGSVADTELGTMTVTALEDGWYAVRVSIDEEVLGNVNANCQLMVWVSDADNDRTEDALEGLESYPFTLCDSTPVAPEWATVAADGAEQVVAYWPWETGERHLVVASTDEIGERQTPTQGLTELAAGTTLSGLGKVAYFGADTPTYRATASAAEGTPLDWKAQEITVKAGSANYVAVYGVSGDAETGYYFSAPRFPKDYRERSKTVDGTGYTEPCEGTTATNSWPCETVGYEYGEGVDAFEYETPVTASWDQNPVALATAFGTGRPETGNKWKGKWTGDTEKWKIHDGSLTVGGTRYPTPTGNMLFWEDTSGSSPGSAVLTRQLRTKASGNLFVAAVLNYAMPWNTSHQGKWVNIALMAGDTELVSFGKQGGSSDTEGEKGAIYTSGPFGNHYFNTTDEDTSAYRGYSYTMNSGYGENYDYVVVGQLDRENRYVRMWVFQRDEQIPELYTGAGDNPTALKTIRASWQWPVGTTVPDVTGIRIQAGSDGSGSIGQVHVDEVRFANNWEDLFNFAKPVVYSFEMGLQDGVDEDGYRKWKVSDGALAHGNVALEGWLDLHHRTGIHSADFTILDTNDVVLLKTAADVAPEGGTSTTVDLTPTAPDSPGTTRWHLNATGAALPTNWVSLESNYVVQVHMTTTGGRENTATTAETTGGEIASDLFFGEYGECTRQNNYLEIYNGTGADKNLADYWLGKLDNARTEAAIAEAYASFPKSSAHAARLGWWNVKKLVTTVEDGVTTYSAGTMDGEETNEQWPRGRFILPHMATVCVIPSGADSDFVLALLKNGCRVIQAASGSGTGSGVMNVGGDDPQLLFHNPTATVYSDLAGCEWLDMAGMTYPGRPAIGGDTGQYIMFRLDSVATVPRRYPDVVDWKEWNYRDWLGADQGTGWTNALATAGAYDLDIGLGGDMKFTVYDDDTEGPVLQSGGVRPAGGGRMIEVTPSAQTYVMGGWSFTNMPKKTVDGKETDKAASEVTAEEYEWIAEMWPYGLTTAGGLSWDDRIAEEGDYATMIEPGTGKGQVDAEFNGVTQVKKGNLLVKAHSGFSKTAEVWVGFDMETAQMADRTLSFAFAGGANGFQQARVEWSRDGVAWNAPDAWLFSPNTGGPEVYEDWTGDLEAAEVDAAAGHLWFRVVLSGYVAVGGTFRLDNIRLEGCPGEVVVTDDLLAHTGILFEALVRDEDSGVVAGDAGLNPEEGAQFDCGVSGMDLYRRAAATERIDGTDYTKLQWTAGDPAANGGAGGELSGGFGTDVAQEWFAASATGGGSLRIEVSDADNDRPNDEAWLKSSFGALRVRDDDEEPPRVRMKTMKPQLSGTLAEWLFADAGSRAASETMERVTAGALGCCTTEGTISTPTLTPYGGEPPTYAAWHKGWHKNSKYWTVTLQADDITDGSVVGETTTGSKVTGLSFQSKVTSVLAPTTFKVNTVRPSGATRTTNTVATGRLAATGGWTKTDEAGKTPIKTWRTHTVTFSTPVLLTDGEELELQIQGTEAPANGISAPWYIYDLKVNGELVEATVEGAGEEATTYVTDQQLAEGEGSATMKGWMWDRGSGVHAGAAGDAKNPRYSFTVGGTTKSGELTFPNGHVAAGSELDATPTETSRGFFTASLTGMRAGYADMALRQYTGTLTAWDEDADRTVTTEIEGGEPVTENVDQLELAGQFAFTVVDQDVAGPGAPTDVTVGRAKYRVQDGTVQVSTDAEHASWAALDRETADWTNNPEFLVGFGAAADRTPAEAGMAAGTWIAGTQDGVTGVGEYRVALDEDTASTRAAAKAFSAGAPEGVIANGGFEGSGGWEIVAKSSNDGVTTDKFNPKTGSRSLQLIATASETPDRYAQQIIPVKNTAGNTLSVGGSLMYYRNTGSSIGHFRVQAFTDTSLSEQVGATRDVTFSGADVETWTSFTVASQPIGDGSVNCIVVTLLATGAGVHFDDVAATITAGEGNTASTVRYVADPAGQGLNAKYLYAVDADNDRAGDRMEGTAAVFHTAFDCTPPTPVAMDHGTGASTENVDDPTTQMTLTWSPTNVGPDDQTHTNYAKIPSDIRSAATDKKSVLSPWKTYKVYYSEYDPEKVDQSMATEGQTVTNYFFQTFLKEGALGDGKQEAGKGRYTEWASVTADSGIEDTTATTGYDGLKNASAGSVTLYDLENDLEYVFVMVGVDKAGNEGPATPASWATNNTIKFAMTQGVVRASAVINDMLPTDATELANVGMKRIDTAAKPRGAVLYWKAAGLNERLEGVVKKDYDLIFRDAGSFRETGRETWNPATSGENSGTSKTNWNYQTDGLEGISRRKLRFYRASYHNRWQDAVTNAGTAKKQTPLASEDVYSMGRVGLLAGQNLVGLQGLPWTNTMAGAFGTDWPASTRASESTRVEFFGADGHSDTGELYWLCSDGKWMKGSDDYSTTELPASFFARGFSITLPDELPQQYQQFTNTVNGNPVCGMWWHPMMQVPTNAPRAWNPHLEGWMERSGEPGNFTYTLSEDTEVDPGKLYYHANGKQVQKAKFSVEVTYGGRTNNVPEPRFTLVNLNLPVAVNVADLGLVQTNADGTWKGGLLPGNGTTLGDVIYTYDNEHKKVRDNSLMYYSILENKWKNSYGTGLTFYPNDAIIIKSQGERSAGPTTNSTWPAKDSKWIWTYSPTNFYELPTRHMGRERSTAAGAAVP
jgi:hypothetical protein